VNTKTNGLKKTDGDTAPILTLALFIYLFTKHVRNNI